MIRILPFIIFVLFSSISQAFYCQNDLILEGDSNFEVQKSCGEPETVNHWTEGEVKTINTLVSINPRQYVTTQKYYEYEYQEWIYNFGPHRFIQHLIFKNGKLVKISDEGYGY